MGGVVSYLGILEKDLDPTVDHVVRRKQVVDRRLARVEVHVPLVPVVVQDLVLLHLPVVVVHSAQVELERLKEELKQRHERRVRV